MPSRIRQLMTPAINKSMRQYKRQKKQKKTFMAKTQYLISKAQRIKIKNQPDRTKTTKKFLSSTTKKMGLVNKGTG